jgi:hypothetical protein
MQDIFIAAVESSGLNVDTFIDPNNAQYISTDDFRVATRSGEYAQRCPSTNLPIVAARRDKTNTILRKSDRTTISQQREIYTYLMTDFSYSADPRFELGYVTNKGSIVWDPRHFQSRPTKINRRIISLNITQFCQKLIWANRLYDTVIAIRPEGCLPCLFFRLTWVRREYNKEKRKLKKTPTCKHRQPPTTTTERTAGEKSQSEPRQPTGKTPLPP